MLVYCYELVRENYTNILRVVHFFKTENKSSMSFIDESNRIPSVEINLSLFHESHNLQMSIRSSQVQRQIAILFFSKHWK